MNGVLALRFNSELLLVPLSTPVNGMNTHMIKQHGIWLVTALELDTFFKTTIRSKCTIHRGNPAKASRAMIQEPLAKLLAPWELENATWASSGLTRMTTLLLTLTTQLILLLEDAKTSYSAFSERKYTGLWFVILTLAPQWQMLLRQSFNKEHPTIIKQPTTFIQTEAQLALIAIE